MSPIHAGYLFSESHCPICRLHRLILIYQSLDQWIERAKDWPEGSKNRRLRRGRICCRIEQDELRRITATVGEVGEKQLGRRGGGRFGRSWCRRDQKIVSFIVAARRPTTATLLTSLSRCGETPEWLRQRPKTLNLSNEHCHLAVSGNYQPTPLSLKAHRQAWSVQRYGCAAAAGLA